MSAAPVAIVGFGPVGATCANLLGALGVAAIALEKETEVYPLPRAIACDDEVLRIFQSIGLADQMLAQMWSDPSAEFVSARGRTLGTVAPREQPYGQPPMAIFIQPELEKILRAGARRFSSVELRRGLCVEALEPTDSGVRLVARDGRGATQTIHASYVLACDGGSSTVRRLCGIDFCGSTYSQRWLVIDARLERPLERVPRTRFLCEPGRPSMNTPLPLGHHRWEFMLMPKETDEEILARAPELLARFVAPGGLTVVRQSIYTHHARSARRWRHGRILLVGDAAHVMPPFAGQGMSAGIRDASNLCWKVALVRHGLAEERLLDTYEMERRPHVRKMTRLARLAGAIVQTRSRSVAFGRDVLFAALQHVPAWRRAVLESKLKPPAAFRSGLRLRRRRLRDASGTLFEQPMVATAAGVACHLDDALGPGFSLLALDDDPRRVVGAAAPPGLPLTLVRVLSPTSAVPPASQDAVVILPDRDGVLTRWFRRWRSEAVLLRPDRFIYAHGSADELRAALVQLGDDLRAAPSDLRRRRRTRDTNEGPLGPGESQACSLPARR